ncbi:MAG TPA: thioesterase family protein [Jatrophihabitans sp.]|uniref:thioesterase family protein n=1 Tax=Jatrophihabitans sp. TaxID=1932789 RepID=UPI002F019C68
MSDQHAFDVDTAVAGAGPNFSATITDRWSIGPHANGGYVLSVCLQALGRVLDKPDPLAVSAFYQRPVVPGPAEVCVETARSGRRLATGEARLLQGGQELVRVVASFADLSQAAGPTAVSGSAPVLPPPQDCLDLFSGEQSRDSGLETPGIAGRLEYRTPRLPGWRQGSPSGQARAEFWLRLAGGRQADTMALPGLVDMAVPAVFELGHYHSTTIELSVHVRARPAPGWLACRVSTSYLIEGYHEEDFEIWDSTGQLVAQSRQLALLS